MTTLGYRPDIDGLRALAVVGVMTYHADMPGAAGGYLGVDVFFVVSGFLITSLIRQEQQAGTFRPADFFARRVRRLLPAQIVVFVISTLLAGCCCHRTLQHSLPSYWQA